MGEEGQGLAQMFQMMNEMRLNIASQGIGQASAAHRKALSYTKQRYQGLSHKHKKGNPPNQVTIINHPDIRRNLCKISPLAKSLRQTQFSILKIC